MRPGDLDLQRTRRRLEVAGSGVAKPPGEVPPAHLLRRPPQVIHRRHAFALAAGETVAHVQRLGAGDQLAAQDRLERLGLDVGAQPCGDVLGGGVGLLGGEPTLLDREVGAVAGGVDVIDAFDAAVLVDRDEPVGVVRKSLYRGPSIVGSEITTSSPSRDRAGTGAGSRKCPGPRFGSSRSRCCGPGTAHRPPRWRSCRRRRVVPPQE